MNFPFKYTTAVTCLTSSLTLLHDIYRNMNEIRCARCYHKCTSNINNSGKSIKTSLDKRSIFFQMSHILNLPVYKMVKVAKL
jgi:hypothetical protein